MYPTHEFATVAHARPVHVDESKEQLTREVLHITLEVSRLQKERQGLEQQIANLFAFYAKQKQAVKVSART